MQNQRYMSPVNQVQNQIRTANPEQNFRASEQIRPRLVQQAMNRMPTPISKTVEQQTGAFLKIPTFESQLNN